MLRRPILVLVGVQSVYATVSCLSTTLTFNHGNVDWNSAVFLDGIVATPEIEPVSVFDSSHGVSIISRQSFEYGANSLNPFREVASAPGLYLQQQSVSTNVEMRAGSGVFGTSTKVMLDFRPLNDPSAASFFSHRSGIFKDDIDHAEVVRGSNALGIGWVSGAVNLISKSPIDYPDSTVELVVGERHTLGGSVRIAMVNADKTLGLSLNGKRYQGDDFILSADQVSSGTYMYSTVRQPRIENAVYVGPGQLLLSESDLDPDADGNPLQKDFYQSALSAKLEYRPNCQFDFIFSLGRNDGGGLFFNSQGVGRDDGKQLWYQGALHAGDFSARVSYQQDDGGSEQSPVFLYSTGVRQIAARDVLSFDMHYSFDLPILDSARYTVGMDYLDVDSNSQNSLFGRNEDSDPYRLTGYYIQGGLSLHPKWYFAQTLRLNEASFVSQSKLGSRLSLNYAPNERHMLTLARDYSPLGSSALELYVDFPVNIIAPGVLDVWLSGQKRAQTPDDTITLLADFIPAIAVEEASAGVPIQSYYTLINQQLLPQLATAGLITPEIQAFLSTYETDQKAGMLVPYDIFNNAPMAALSTSGESPFNLVKSWTIGYKGHLTDRLQVAFDAYEYSRKGFVRFGQISPVYQLTGSEQIAGKLYVSLFNDLSEYLNGLNPQDQSNAITATADSISQIYAGAASQLVMTVTESLPFYGVLQTDTVPNNGMIHIPAGYIQAPNALRKHYGVDLEAVYQIDDLSITAAASWLNDTTLTAKSAQVSLPSSLNKPKLTAQLGLQYFPRFGWHGSTTALYQSDFISDQGFWSGSVPAHVLVDASVGYRFANRMAVSFAATNLFDEKYSAFPNLPTIRRRALLRVRWDF